MSDRQVNFQINVTGNAETKILNVSSAAEKTTGKFAKLGDFAYRINNIFQTASTIFSKLSTTCSTLTAAYNAQLEAETKLAQVMKNTIGATEEEYRSILKLTSAQQQLGVIGDEVQLAGAQELATYLEKTESLQTLIPVMNDMLAQQYGLNATQEQSVTIGSMLGKVMEGQTGALSRYGYKFDETQEKILKFGTEEQRVATLAEVVTSAVGGVNKALANTDAGRAKQLANTWGDVQEQFGELATKLKSSLVPTMSKLVELASRIADWARNNIEKIKTTIKVVASLVAGFAAYKATVLAVNVASKIHTVLTAAKTAAMALLNGGVKACTASFRAMNVAMKANVIGAVISVVVAAATAFATLRDRAKEANSAMGDAANVSNQYYGQEKAQLDLLFEKLSQTNPKSKERNRLVQQLKEMYPDLNKQILDEITNTNNLSNAYDTLIAKIQDKARAKGLEVIQNRHYETWADTEVQLGSDKGKKYLFDSAVRNLENGRELAADEYQLLQSLGFMDNGRLYGYNWVTGTGYSVFNDYKDSNLRKFVESRKELAEANRQLAEMQLSGVSTDTGQTGLGVPPPLHGTPEGASAGAAAATTGGTRNTTVHINISQMNGVETLNVATMSEGIDTVEQRLAEAMARVLGMAEVSVA